MAASGGVGRWTRSFSVGSALSMVGLQLAYLFDASFRVVALVGLFGAVLPMVFGMAYLLLPSYVGRTLSTQRLPGVHFAATYAGTGLLVGDELLGLGPSVAVGGVFLWSAGVTIFVGTLLQTTLPAILANPATKRLPGVPPRRPSELATLAIPVALGYLVVGTVALLSTVDGVPDPLGSTGPMVVHFYATGFVALLIFALGIRLLTGFFRVTPPISLSWLVLSCGSVAPGVLALNFYRPPWFGIGAGLEFVAMAGYASLVAVVAYRTDRHRVGLYGIGLGAAAGVLSVGVALASVTGIGGNPDLAAHVIVALDGFLLLTIIGYAYQFFPVSNGQFPGATGRTAASTIALLGTGTAVHALGVVGDVSSFRFYGPVLALIGTVGYSYLLIRRFLSPTGP
ncbi:hypothetical protein [Halosimplex salinum]|uniref:hypothetical protein n=1 Tax=Halosimplex salinum TaxID=1710538 RepID=UPI0013DE5BD3|nr:hypothetical protein [Halosimplex salinum]